MKVTIEPTRQQVAAWIETFMPAHDLFFLEEKELAFFGIELAGVLVVPIKEFMAHAEYRRLQFANSYLYWNIAARFSHVLVAQPDWIDRLAPPMKQRIFKMQAESGRGLVFPVDMLPEVPADYTVELDGAAYAVLQHAVWQRLGIGVKERFLKAYALLWDRPDCFALPESAPPHLAPFANRYSDRHGSNCLSAALFAATGEAWIAGEWVHPETFWFSVERLGFRASSKAADSGDIVAWSNKKGVVQHAAYCLGDALYFNKNGQTFFNPWKIVDGQELDAVWAHLDKTVYVRQ